jgi:tetratricopeptide (TPR) repeat protein
MLPDRILTDAELTVFVKKIHSQVEKLLSAKDRAEAFRIYASVTSEKRSSYYINNVAISLWMSGYPEIALFILGKECTVNMKNDNNLNNYASFLTMTGGEHAALPILRNLNEKFPGNSTILNNIGQAWYGLGHMNNAKIFLDRAVRIYRNHSQANQTKGEIQQSEGNSQDAIESLKRSIKENYTPEKEARLNKFGETFKYEDIYFYYPEKAQTLGLEKFLVTIPSYPFEGGLTAEISRMEWSAYRNGIFVAEEALKKQIERLKENVSTYADRAVSNSRLLSPYNNSLYITASRRLALLTEWTVDRTAAFAKKIFADDDSVNKWRIVYNQAMAGTSDCGTRKGIATDFLSKANVLRQQRNAEWLSFQKIVLNAHSRLLLYGCPDRSVYELAMATTKEIFLSYLRNLRCEFESGCVQTEPQEGQRRPLPDFDSVNCKYSDKIFIPPFTTITVECNRMSTEFEIDTEEGVKVKLGWEENLNTRKITKGTLEVGLEGGVSHNIGPVAAELKGEAAIGIEITEDGVQEVYMRVAASGELRGFVDEDHIDEVLKPDNEKFMTGKGSTVLSAEAKTSWNAGKKGAPPTTNTSASASGFCNSINIGN